MSASIPVLVLFGSKLSPKLGNTSEPTCAIMPSMITIPIHTPVATSVLIFPFLTIEYEMAIAT